MGLTTSKTIIPIKEADAKLGPVLRMRLDKAYQRITEGASGDSRPLDSKAFQRNFLEAFPLMPKILMESLFDAFGAARRGAVSLEEFVCAVAVMHRGTAPEQLRMLFEVYDLRRATYIEIDHVRRLLDHVYGSPHSKAIDQALAWLFRGSSREDEMDAEEFIARLTPVVDYRGTAAAAQAEPLLQWFRVLCTRILEEPHPAVVALEQRYNPERDLNKVVTKYKLSPGLTDLLCRRHALICRRSSTNALDVQEWLSAVGYLIPEPLARRVFQFFAQSGGLAWTVADLMRFLCACVLDSRQEHVSMVFQLFDVDRDGLLSEPEVAQMLEHLAAYHAHRAGGGGGGGGAQQHQAHHHRGQHRHNYHRHHPDTASLTLGLRKLGYEDIESMVALDRQNTTKTAAASDGAGDDGGADAGGDSGGARGVGGANGSGGCSITRVVARQLLRDMRATSERYVVVSAPAVTGAEKAKLGGGGSDRRYVEQSRRGRGAGNSIHSRAPAGRHSTAMKEGGVGGSGLTFAGFMAWSSVHGGRLMLVKDLVYACLAEFGMRPAKAVQEREVIQEIFRRYEAEAEVALNDADESEQQQQQQQQQQPFGPEGTTWSVISAHWWAQWRDFSRIGSDAVVPRGTLSRGSSSNSIASNGVGGGGGSVGSGGRQQQLALTPTSVTASLSGDTATTASPSPRPPSPPVPSSLVGPAPTMTPRSRASSRVFGSAPVLGGRGNRAGGGGPGGGVGGSMGGRGGRGVGAGGGGGGGGGGGAYLSSTSSFATQQAARPTQINNGPLLEHAGSRRILRTARLGQDFAVIPPKAWDALQSWYDGGPLLERRVINYHGSLQLELFPLSLKVASCDVKGKPRQFEREMLFSKVDKVSDVAKQLSEANKVEPERTRLWNYADRVDWKKQHVLTPGHTLEEANLLDGQLVLLEISQQDGAWPRSQLQSMLEAEEEEAMAGTAVSAHNKGVIGDGMVGLGNLGNTCYINSSVQCLSHTPLLTEYFLSSAYVNDVNVENKLGLQGRLAHVYADLVNDLWSPTKKTVTPKSFKNEIAKFNDLFGGHDQHDAQELLAFLLNGLNEDLNRIADKPYIEQPDSDGRSDAELADIWWKNHLRREFSIVVALFAGQFKSVLACRECGYESARFEPFMFLQLPLPEDTERSVMVIVVLLDGARCPAKCSLRLPKTGRVSDLVRAIVDTFNAPPTERVRRPRPSPPDPPKIVAEAEAEGEAGAEAGVDGKLNKEDEVGEGEAGEEAEEEQEEEEEEEEEEEDNLEEERRFYTRVGLRCEDLAVVDINAHKIFATVSPDRTLQSMKEHEMFYVYQLERDVYGEAAAAAAAAKSAAAPPAPPVAVSPADEDYDAETDEDDDGDDADLVDGDGAAAAPGKATAATVPSGGGGGPAGPARVAAVPRPAADQEEGVGSERTNGTPAGDKSGTVIANSAGAAPGQEGEEEEARISPAPECHHPEPVDRGTSSGGPGTRRQGKGSGIEDDGASPLPPPRPPAASASSSAGGVKGKPSSAQENEKGGAVAAVAAKAQPQQRQPQPMKQIRTPVRLFAVLHRRLETNRNFLANPYRLEVFGTPLVCRVVPMTGRQLYDKLYRRFHRFLRLKAGGVSAASPGAAAAAGGASPSHQRKGGHNGDAGGHEDFGGVQPCMGTGDDRDCPRTVRATSAWVAAGEVNRWGFRLRLVESSGYACSRCRWTEGCVGCFIRPDDQPCPVRAGDSVGVDWHISVIKEHYDASEALSCLLHSSIALHKDLEARPLSLEKCLDTFTAQEDIKEGYCSRCKEFRNASKKMDVWRLPPILAIQLKRFQYTQYSRRKLRNNVHFPVNGLDLSPYVVKDPGGSGSGGGGGSGGSGGGGGESASKHPTQLTPSRQQPQQQQARPPDDGIIDAMPRNGVGDGVVVGVGAGGDGDGASVARSVVGGVTPSAPAVAPGAAAADVRRDHRPNGTGVLVPGATPGSSRGGGGDVMEVPDGGEEEEDDNDEPILPARMEVPTPAPVGDEEARRGGDGAGAGMANAGVIGADGGRGGSLYDLYAVVHHLGALSSGHYVASVKSQPSGKWHYFNDDQVTEVDEDELGSSSSSAYILFYMRRDCAGLRIEDVYPSGPPKTVEEVEALMLHRDAAKCRIM